MLERKFPCYNGPVLKVKELISIMTDSIKSKDFTDEFLVHFGSLENAKYYLNNNNYMNINAEFMKPIPNLYSFYYLNSKFKEIKEKYSQEKD